MKNNTNKNFRSFFTEAASKLSINFNSAEIELFETYLIELLVWNKKINITSIISTEDIIIKHFLDSVTVLHYVPLSGKIVDLGSGGGFPGIPLKIKKPSLEIVLIESIRKKANFLRHIIRTLNLEGIEVYNGRAEHYNRREYFDYSVSRAFADLKTYSETALTLIKNSGSIVAMKGKNPEKELKNTAQTTLSDNISVSKINSFFLPFNRGERTIIVLKKEKCFT